MELITSVNILKADFSHRKFQWRPVIYIKCYKLFTGAKKRIDKFLWRPRGGVRMKD